MKGVEIYVATSIGMLINRLMHVRAQLGMFDLLLESDRATRDQIRESARETREEANALLDGTADEDALMFLKVINGLYGDEDLRGQLGQAERHLMSYVHKLFGQRIMIALDVTEG